MTEQPHPIEKIHHINTTFNRRFSGVLYYAGAFVTLLFLIFPYTLRTALAFFVNIFFNRPQVYLGYLRIIGREMSIVPMLVLYIVGIGVYAIFLQVANVFRKRNSKTRWVLVGSNNDRRLYDRQS